MVLAINTTNVQPIKTSLGNSRWPIHLLHSLDNPLYDLIYLRQNSSHGLISLRPSTNHTLIAVIIILYSFVDTLVKVYEVLHINCQMQFSIM